MLFPVLHLFNRLVIVGDDRCSSKVFISVKIEDEICPSCFIHMIERSMFQKTRL